MQIVGKATFPSAERQIGRRYKPTWKDVNNRVANDVSVYKVSCGTYRAPLEMNVFVPNISSENASHLKFVRNGFSNGKQILQRYQS